MAGSRWTDLTVNRGERVRRSIWVIAVLLLAVDTADAQGGMGGMGGMGRGRGGMGGRRGGGMTNGGSRAPSMKFPAAKSLEKYNPAALVADNHKKLSLADSQVASFRQLGQRIFERNAALLARYDSLQKGFRPPRIDATGGGASEPAADSTRRVAMIQMRQLRTLVDSLQDRRRADVQEVLGALSDEAQRKKAAELLDKQDVDFSKEFPAPPVQRGDRSGEAGPDGTGRGRRRPPTVGLR